MSKINYTSSKLARDENGSVAQVASYRTPYFTNIDGTLASANTGKMEGGIVRIKSYDGDNWVTICTTTNGNININLEVVLSVSGSGNEILNSNEYTNVGAGMFISPDGPYVLRTGNTWAIWDENDYELFTSSDGDANNIPTTGWVLNPLNGGILPLPMVSHVSGFVASIDQGMLLQEGEELTLNLHEDDVIATIGGKLNIVPIIG